MYKAYKFRMYPKDNQKTLIHKTFGCNRYIYNYFLDKCKNNRYINAYEMIKELPKLKEEHEWLKEIDSCSLRCSIFNLEKAYQNFFAKRSDSPKFKSKIKRQTYRTNCIRREYKGNNYTNIEIDLINKKIKLPKLGMVEIRGYRNLEKINGRIINATISYETTGKYYVSIIVEEKEVIKENINPKTIVGIDLGVKDIVVTSSGEKYQNLREIQKYEKRIIRMQKQLSRKNKKSNNYEKTRIKISRTYEKLRNSRKHNIIRIVNKLVKEYDIIISEKLKVKEMTKKCKYAKNILDVSFNKICNMIKWKSKAEGKYYYQIDRYYPSSKICSHCNNKTEKTKNLEVRKWVCEKCHFENDRDINASINIMFEGIKYCFDN